MRRSSLRYGDAVRVHWVDSQSGNGWSYPRVKQPVAHIVSMGYVVKNEEGALAISTSIAHNSAFIDPLAIPWECIHGVEKIGKEWNRAG